MPAKDPTAEKAKAIRLKNKAMIRAALEAAKGAKAKYFFIYIDAVEDNLIPEVLPKGLSIILVTKKKNPPTEATRWQGKTAGGQIITLPKLALGRIGMIKVAVILAISAKLVEPDDILVFLGGKAELGQLDILLTFKIGGESEIITGTDFADIPETVKPAVFEHALNLAIELANKGREGKPIGTIFVLGDEEKVMQLSKQMIMNPFKGYEEEERNLLNPALKETIREFSALDGAFVISGEGEVITAGRYLGAATDESEIPRGLGARHIAAAGITALTNAIAIVISESTGDVRIFRNGKVIMEIEKTTR
ncbi:MAG: DNA integrity scanning protein DisA nucleotide-binding domain protein [Deltaproteobacteria bacterium]|nr:DNA integrity scanning protein DisA nucleotide-binding domain protein [Deltaproteobacteria bacterium]